MPPSRDRPLLSCARCYLMKKKCDKKVPSCSRCTQAKTECLGINRSDRTEVPRSAVQYLESRLAELANDAHQLNEDGVHRSTSRQSFPAQEGSYGSDVAYDHVVSIAGVAFGSVCSSSVLEDQPGIHYDAKLFYGSERPPLKIPVKGIYNEYPPRMASRGATFRLPELPNMVARGIPFQVAERLFENYVKNVLPRWPCFLESDLIDQFNSYYRKANVPEQILPESTCFIVSMIQAISSLTSKAHDFWKVASLSESLQRDALRHSSFLGNCNFRTLQCFLLLIQMALLLPYTANQWYMSGEAMRIAIALGLHQELPDHRESDLAIRNLRRSVFWTVYQLERTIAIASGCPLAISDEHISTRKPSTRDTPNHSFGANSYRIANVFQHHVHLSQLQSEIHGVQFFDQTLPADTADYADWIRKVENSVQNWQECLTSDGDIPGWSINAADHCRLLLYRPCSRNIVPSESGLRAASTVAIRTINGHWALVQAGNLIFSFQYVYNVFQAGMVLLYTLGNHGPIELGFMLEEEAHQALNLLIPLFDALSTRWPAAADAGHYVKELKDIIQRSIDPEEISGQSAHDINLLAELDFMVTQRRIHSVYHRNVDILPPEQRMPSELSPWDPLTPLRDELWQDIVNTSFEYLADDSLMFPEMSDNLPINQSNNFPVETTLTTNARNEENSTSSIEVDMLIQSIPACGSCRTQHIKCDRKFPSCSSCAKPNRECVYYDAVLQVDVLRSHVHNLYERYKALTSNRTSGTFPSWAPPRQPPVESSSTDGILVPSHSTENDLTSSSTEGDFHLSLNNWFFGPSSTFVRMQHEMSLAFGSRLASELHYLEPWKLPSSQLSLSHCPDPDLPPISVSVFIFEVFSRCVHTFYPTITDNHLAMILDIPYSTRENDSSHHDQDLFYLITAIGAQLMNRHSSGLAFAAHVYFHKATHHPARSRDSWLRYDQLLLLQRSVLICIYLLLNPAGGDIWRNLGFAIRLYFDLSHRPSTNDDMNEELMCMLFRTLYSLESQVSIAFGRPSLLVIGDKVREEMTELRSGTIQERVSCYSYRIALLKMQIHSSMLSKASKISSLAVSAEVVLSYKHDLDFWLADWRKDLVPFLVTDDNKDNQLYISLEAWAALHYNHASLLLSQISPGKPAYDDILKSSNQIIQSCSYLVGQQKVSLLRRPSTATEVEHRVFIYPMNWTVAHLVFGVGLYLLPKEKRRLTTSEKLERMGMTRRAMTLLALLEGDPMMLSTDFSQVLESIFLDTETNEGAGR